MTTNFFNTTANTSSLFNNPNPTNTSTNPFGTSGTNTTNTNIFGTSGTNTTSTNLFGTPGTSSTNTTLFGNPGTNTTNTLFGNPGTNTTNTTLFGNPGTNTTSTSLFGNSTVNTGTFPSSSTTNTLFGNPTLGSSLFPTSSLNNPQPSSNSIFQVPPEQGKQLIITSIKPILTLQSSNSLRFNKLSSFGDEYKKIINQIQLELTNNSLKISYAERLISRLEQNFKTVKSEGLNVVKLSKVINTKNTKIKLILNNLRTEMKKLNESLEKEKNNFRILQLGSDMTLTIPNDFLLYYTQELGERMKSYATQIEDIQSLINLYYSEESGNFKVNSDMIEEVIVELFKCIKILLSDEAILSEYVNSVKNNFALLLKNVGGFNDFQIKARFESYLDRDQ